MKKDFNLAELAHKYILSLEEAVRYFGIGEKRMRSLAQEYEDAPWLLMVGSHYRIKRPQFERWLESVTNL